MSIRFTKAIIWSWKPKPPALSILCSGTYFVAITSPLNKDNSIQYAPNDSNIERNNFRFACKNPVCHPLTRKRIESSRQTGVLRWGDLKLIPMWNESHRRSRVPPSRHGTLRGYLCDIPIGHIRSSHPNIATHEYINRFHLRGSKNDSIFVITA